MGKKRIRTLAEMEQDERNGLTLTATQQQLLQNALSRLPHRYKDICMLPENEEIRVRCVRGMDTEDDPVQAIVDAISSVLAFREGYKVDGILSMPLEQQGPCPKERHPLTREQVSAFHRMWPTMVYGHDEFGHVIHFESVQRLDIQVSTLDFDLSKFRD